MRRLVVLGCSETKRDTGTKLPAVDLYDGPIYRVLRAFLREYLWPDDLSIAILSAQHGLIGGMTPVEFYDLRMTRQRAQAMAGEVRQTLSEWRRGHSRVQLVLGVDYLEAIRPAAKTFWRSNVELADGPIGMKLQYLNRTLRQQARKAPRRADDSPRYHGRPAYFLPDWDDFVDIDFNFDTDEFSSKVRSERNEVHCSALVRPASLADGILVSLAQSLGGKGLLRSLNARSRDSLAPKQVKAHFGLADNQWAFGDCGAFSYVNETEPTISIEQAVSTYELYGFDLGASVDHIPVPEVFRNGKTVKLKQSDRADRVRLTKVNAEAFLSEWRRRECRFHPVGVVQALSPQQYANTAAEYTEMGYRRIALGGLVPKSDAEIKEIVSAVYERLSTLRERPWLHLLGVFRPDLQTHFRRCDVDSFDSATYFRKSWLRSDQNYLCSTGKWYAAIRVPPSHDPRTAKRLAQSGFSKVTIRRMERKALQSLRSLSDHRISVDRCLKAVLEYDALLHRGESEERSLADAYRRTLTDRPWEYCKCRVCQALGLNALIFRGLNRNKRRGAHNTLMLYKALGSQATENML